MTYKELCAMQFHEERDLSEWGNTTVMRVPGGWIYTTTYEVHNGPEHMNQLISQCFVPQPKELKP